MSERMDNRVAREVCGWREVKDWGNIWRMRNNKIRKHYIGWTPSTNIAHAIEALELAAERVKGLWWCLCECDNGKFRCDIYHPQFHICEMSKTACLAICRALLAPKVLRALREHKKKK